VFLENEVFRTVVGSTPLVSMDLIVRRPSGEILLGQRLNRPAQGYWFVPGGRILKNEGLDAAFARLTLTELGQGFARSDARLLGVYEHFYQDSVFGEDEASPNTHYVVLGYQLDLPEDFPLEPPTEQHGSYQWWSVDAIRDDNRVHRNTQAYLADLMV
jgi:colanic acid biosynthesis protein WcaH